MKTIVFALLAIFTAAMPAPAAAQPGTPLPVDAAFDLDVARAPDGRLTLKWEIAPGYYLYREQIAVSTATGQAVAVDTSPGTRKDDPTFGPSEVYYGQATARLAEPVFGTIEVTYQGCQDGGICYAPEKRRVDALTLAVSAPPRPAPGAGVAWLTEEASTGDGALPGGAGFALAADDGLIDTLLGQGGVLLVVLSFPLFGLLLAFTPCVFPMYPILAGALAREGDKLTARRGFVLSTIYVLSLALAFAFLGAAAGWSGQNLQLVLQSPVTIGLLAILFAVLALSMFGLYELQLPAAWTSWIARRTGGFGGSKRSAALLGFSSVLIVGPCVTVPLAGALLYIAQTADVALGAAALFGLGIGKGLPLIVLGTLGGRALPRAGAWMDSVKRVFGFGFLATAIWTATPLLPAGIDLALWAALLIAIASFALTARLPAPTPLAAARALGAIALVCGVILMLGAASGGTDPLRPLAQFAQRGTQVGPGRELAFASVGSAPELKARLGAAGGRPTLVYFTADWCVTCRVIERSVLPDPAVADGLANFQLVKADLSEFNDDNAALMRAMRVAGPPTMVFFDAAGSEVAKTRLIGSVTVDSLTRSAAAAREL